MNAVEPMIPRLVALELNAANLENPPFRSMHEGYAVILEEMDEADDAMNRVKGLMDNLWRNIKDNRPGMVSGYARHLKNEAMHLAAEVIQVAAMARKLQNSLEGEDEQGTETHAGNAGL